MRFLPALMALLMVPNAASAQWTPRNQAILYVAPADVECKPCDALKAHLRAEYEGIRIGPEKTAHFVVREMLEMKVPMVVYFDAEGKSTGRHVGYNHLADKKERIAELRKIAERHPKFIPDKKTPPPAPPVQDASLERTVAAKTESKTVQYGMIYSGGGDCSGGGGGIGGGGDFYQPSYAIPFSADCGGGGIGGGVGGGVGGGDFYQPNYSYSYAPQPMYYAPRIAYYAPRSYVPRSYVVRSYAAPYASTPYMGSGGINNFSLINLQPQVSLFNGGSLFGQQRAYGMPAYSPRMQCGPNGCVVY